MKQLYFIRHGLSEMNKQNVLSGRSDTPLAEEGHEQARTAGHRASEQGLVFDVIVSSPLQRAHHTARHIAAAVGYPHDEIELNDLFQERGYGSLEGYDPRTKLGADYFTDESVIDHHLGAETLQALQSRADQALAYLNSLEHGTVLVVAHGAFGRALYRSLNQLPITVRDIHYQNAEIVRFL
jgi:broad specificity phosphatase PhoE